MNFLKSNNQIETIFGPSQNLNEIIFATNCTDAKSNLLWNGNLLYQITPSAGKPQYTNGVYICYYDGGDWVIELIGTQEEARGPSSSTYPWQAGIGIRSCPDGDCGEYGASLTIDGRTLYYIGDTSYTDGQYIVYYDVGFQWWTYDEIGVQTFSTNASLLPYPWLFGMGEKDCSVPYYNAVIVNGAGTSSSDGVYTLSSPQNYHPYYVNGNSAIFFDGTFWYLYDDTQTINTYALTTNVLFPWEGTWDIEDAAFPPPSVTPTVV